MHTQFMRRSGRGYHGRLAPIMDMCLISFIEVHTFGGRGSPF